MKELLRALLESKKFAATVAAILVWVLGRAGLDVSDDMLLPIVGSLVAFVLAQGWADKGKEAVKEAAKLRASAPGGEKLADPR